MMPGTLIDNYEVGGGITTKTENEQSLYLVQTKFEKSFSNSKNDMIFQFNYRYQDLIDCSVLRLSLIKDDFSLNEIQPEKKLPLQVKLQLCGSFQTLSIDLNYEEKNLQWLRNVRAPRQNLKNLFEPHLIRISIYQNRTYKVQIDQEIIVNEEFLNGWNIVGPTYLVKQKEIEPRNYRVYEMKQEKQETAYEEIVLYGEDEKEFGKIRSRQIDVMKQQNDFDNIQVTARQSLQLREKNRDFSPSRHQNAHIIGNINGIQVIVEENHKSFLIDNVLLTDDLDYADQKKAFIEKMYKRVQY
ncbi:calreticulin precursor [Stylonychia lemnae]|uniref:Calreticulin n=1 Tax=Stylonychia lemnae TaxID=5949 RepID=A0A078B064_STYLE|nr:calreticulin precursor [Stylonychia lemnae]|eukprot:CDW86807.1 calreticulin precursor [Stylonychia lemnae]